MRLWVMRHAEAQAHAASDAQRQLTARGQAQAQQTAQWLADHAVPGLRLVASPYLRAQQTAAVVSAHLQSSVATLDLLTPDQDVRLLHHWLLEQPQTDILLVSHMPLVGLMVGWLEQGNMEGSPFTLAEVRGLDMELPGPGLATLRQRYYPVGL